MSGIIDLFIPKEKKFFDCLSQQITLLTESVKKLNELNNHLIKQQELEKTLHYIKKRSEQANVISIDIVNFLHQTFITPIDREEIKVLSTSIIRIIDSIEKISASLYYFKIKKIDTSLVKQLVILEESINNLASIFKHPLLIKKNKQYIDSIKNLENDADDLYRKSLGSLFTNAHAPLEILKQKELYEITEEAIDDTKYLAELLEMVLINNS